MTWYANLKKLLSHAVGLNLDDLPFLWCLLRSPWNDKRALASTRSVLRVLKLPNSTPRKILNFVFHMFLCWLQHVQVFHSGDKQQRFDFANEFLIRKMRMTNNLYEFCRLTMPIFSLTGNFNLQNYVHWQTIIPIMWLHFRYTKEKWLCGTLYKHFHHRSLPFWREYCLRSTNMNSYEFSLCRNVD